MSAQKVASFPMLVVIFVTLLACNLQTGAHAQLGDLQTGSGIGGIISTLLSPVHETLKRAANLFVKPVENVENFVHDGFNAIEEQAFRMFMQFYNKTYLPEEIPKRMHLFLQRRPIIEQSIEAFREGKLPFQMRINRFIDWDEKELKTLVGARPPPKGDDARKGPQVSRGADGDKERSVRAPVKIPASYDGRETGCIGAVVDQGQCGCCYSVATMGTLESMRCIVKSSSPLLSSQQIIDCSKAFGNNGCDGGWPTKVLKYLQYVGLSTRSSCYKFTQREDYCKLNTYKYRESCVVPVNQANEKFDYKILDNEEDILYHVATTGPVTAVLEATDPFLYYDKGIFEDRRCGGGVEDSNHAVIIVGYGREAGRNYWLIKNSWGTDWGEQGYGKIRRGTHECSIGHWAWVIKPSPGKQKKE